MPWGSRCPRPTSGSRPHTRPSRRRKAMEASKAIWSGRSARLGADVAAAAPFSGGPPAKEEVPKIKAAVLVHHGERDTRLVASWPAYDAAMKEANVTHEGYVYPGAVHGFHCDATPERYN